jgi:conjugative relaxase-like TrwC/TraI family protein
VKTNEYINVMHGYTQDKKLELCQTTGRNHRHGWDLTFSLPKSCSLAWARADQKLKTQIQEAHNKGVLSALEFIEEQAAFTRRGHNGYSREKVVGLVAAIFEHSTSRAQDPHYHSHCLIANAAPREDSSWGTIESNYLYQWKMASGALYRAELANNLLKLGFEIEQDQSSFRLVGIPEKICEYYSKRSNEIKQELMKRDIHKRSSKAGDIITLSTRQIKRDVNRAELYGKWFRELDEQDFQQVKLDKLLAKDKHQEFSWLSILDHSKPELTLVSLNKRLTEKLSVFRMQDVYRTAAEIAQLTGDNAKSAQRIAKQFIEQESSISLGLDHKHNALFTTQEIIDNERLMIEGAKRLSHQTKFGISSQSIELAISNKKFQLSEEQQEAVVSVCQEQHFSILQGSAGAGKSASMDCVRIAYENEGFKVVGATIAKSAAKNLAQEANIETHTVAKLLSDINKGKSLLNEKTILLVDEAGQLGTKQLAKLVSAAEVKGSKLVLVGEDKQLEAIEHSGSLRYLSRPEILGASRIETIRRQNTEWARRTVSDFRDGNAIKALNEYNNRGLLYFSDDSRSSKQCLVEQWNSYRKSNPYKKSLLLAQRWQDVTELNYQVRTILQTEGKIDQKEIEVSCSVSNRQINCKMAAGERIKFTKNDYQRGYTNGELGIISSIERLSDGDIIFSIRADSDKRIVFKASDYSNDKGEVYLTQAYAQTVYSSQGLTVDGDVFVYYTTGMDRAHTYVACSRHKDKSHLFVNKNELSLIPDLQNCSTEMLINEVAKAMSINKHQNLAVEYVDVRDKKITQQSKNYERGEELVI